MGNMYNITAIFDSHIFINILVNKDSDYDIMIILNDGVLEQFTKEKDTYSTSQGNYDIQMMSLTTYKNRINMYVPPSFLLASHLSCF